MNDVHENSFRLFVMLHIDMIKKLFLIDILFLVCSIWYIGILIPKNIEYFRTGILVLLIILVFVVITMRVVSAYSGTPEYYRLLPLNGNKVIFKSHLLILIPFFLAICLVQLLFFSLSYYIKIDMIEVLVKAGQIFTVFCTIKLLAVPTLLIMRKSLLLLSAFYLLLIPIIYVVMVFDELFFSSLPLPLMWDMVTFVLILFGLELMVLLKYK